MPLIKANNAPAAAKPFSLADIERHARRMLENAMLQAEQILAEAQEQADVLKAGGHAEGVEAGRAEGLQLGRAEGIKLGQQQALAENKAKLTQLVQTLTKSATELDASRKRLEADALRDVAELALAVARRVTKRQGLIDPQVLAGNLADAMRLTVGASDVRIAVHPSQRQLLEQTIPQLKLNWPTLKHVELAEDPSIAPGGCRIASGQGEVDADLNTQLDRVTDELLPES